MKKQELLNYKQNLSKGLPFIEASRLLNRLLKLQKESNSFEITDLIIDCILELFESPVALDGSPFIRLFKFPALKMTSAYTLSVFLDLLNQPGNSSVDIPRDIPVEFQLKLLNGILQWVNGVQSVDAVVQCLPGICGALAKICKDGTRKKRVLAKTIIYCFNDSENNPLILTLKIADTELYASNITKNIANMDTDSSKNNSSIHLNQKENIRNIEWFQTTRKNLEILFKIVSKDIIFCKQILENCFQSISNDSRILLLESVFATGTILENCSSLLDHGNWIRFSLYNQIQKFISNSSLLNLNQQVNILMGYLHIFELKKSNHWAKMELSWFYLILDRILKLMESPIQSLKSNVVQSTNFKPKNLSANDIVNREWEEEYKRLIHQLMKLIHDKETFMQIMNHLFQQKRQIALLWIVKQSIDQSKDWIDLEIAQKWINDLFVDNQLTDFQENQYSIVLVDKFASILKTNFQPLLMNTLPDMLFHAYIQSIPGNLFDPKNLECRLIPYHSINPYHQFLENVSIQTGYKDILQMLNDCGGWLIHWISIQLRYPVSKNHGSWEIFKALGVTFGLISLTIESENERNLIQLMRDGLEEVLLLWCDYSRPKDGYYSNDQALICVAILDVLYAVMGVLNRMNNEPKVIENTNINEEEQKIPKKILDYLAERRKWDSEIEENFQEEEDFLEKDSQEEDHVHEKAKPNICFEITRNILNSIQHGILSDIPLIQYRVLQIIHLGLDILHKKDKTELISFMFPLWTYFGSILESKDQQLEISHLASFKHSLTCQIQTEVVCIITTGTKLVGDFFKRPISDHIVCKYHSLLNQLATKNPAEISSRTYKFSRSFRTISALMESILIMANHGIFAGPISSSTKQMLISIGELFIGQEQAKEIRQHVYSIYRVILDSDGDWLYAHLLFHLDKSTIQQFVQGKSSWKLWTIEDEKLNEFWSLHSQMVKKVVPEYASLVCL